MGQMRMKYIQSKFRARAMAIVAASLLASGLLASGSATAQVETIDPNAAIDADLSTGSVGTQPAAPVAVPAGAEAGTIPALPAEGEAAPATGAGADYATYPAPGQPYTPPLAEGGVAPVAAASSTAAYQEDDLIGAAEGVFGKGAAGLADLIRDLLKKQGKPNGYIVGREGGGALVFGLRYGSGTLHHKVEGERPVYWTGPSIGFDAGANAASTFVLVYNLYDTEDVYKRFPAGEGQAYLVGGFHVSYMRKGDIVLIPVRSGAGLRLGVNGGYMKFSRKQNWFPF